MYANRDSGALVARGTYVEMPREVREDNKLKGIRRFAMWQVLYMEFPNCHREATN
jgi:hypothetical protein